MFNLSLNRHIEISAVKLKKIFCTNKTHCSDYQSICTVRKFSKILKCNEAGSHSQRIKRQLRQN